MKEYLTSTRLDGASDNISRFHVSMTLANTIMTQACLGILVQLDENVADDSLEELHSQVLYS